MATAERSPIQNDSIDFEKYAQQVETFVRSFFEKNQNKNYRYHDLGHTLAVVEATRKIANHFQLDDQDYFIVQTAAWFHDIGYFIDTNEHEIQGASLAQTFLSGEGVSNDLIDSIKKCILATRLPQSPQNLLEKIVCDADLYHFGTKEFKKRSKQLKKEVELRKGTPIKGRQWRKETAVLLEKHQYHTDYCRLLLNDVKAENLKELKQKIEKDEEKVAQKVAREIEMKKPQKEDAKKNTTKQKKPDKGVQTLFRLTGANNQRLSNMADNKAHILITVNSIILSAIISLLLRQLETYSYYTIPTIITLFVCLTTIIFSILATRPKLPSGHITQADIDNKTGNLIFFGNFYKMTLEEYKAGMYQVLEDHDFLYNTLIKDVFSQGKVLSRKYRLLRIAYNFFMYGLIIAVLGFVIATIGHSVR